MTNEQRAPITMPSRTGSTGNGHPVLFSFAPTWDFEPHPDGGGYPIGFLKRAYHTMYCTDPDKVLHLCSGSMRRGVCVDLRRSMKPTVQADVRRLPFRDESFDWVMADPPYSEEYAGNLYGTGSAYPKPLQIINEAARVLRPGGRVGLLHFQVPMSRPPMKMQGTWGITTGAGYAIRVWTVFRKEG